MKRILLSTLFLLTLTFADKIAYTSVICPELEAFKEIKANKDNALELNQHIVNNNCEMIESKEKINVINQMEGDYFLIYVGKYNKNFYIKKNNVILEQPKKKTPLKRSF